MPHPEPDSFLCAIAFDTWSHENLSNIARDMHRKIKELTTENQTLRDKLNLINHNLKECNGSY
jgi:hypothetical protein